MHRAPQANESTQDLRTNKARVRTYARIKTAGRHGNTFRDEPDIKQLTYVRTYSLSFDLATREVLGATTKQKKTRDAKAAWLSSGQAAECDDDDDDDDVVCLFFLITPLNPCTR